MRAYVEGRPHLIVRAARDDYRLARKSQGAEIQRLGQLRFMHGRKPDLLPDLLEFFLESFPNALATAVDIWGGFTDVVGGLSHLGVNVKLRGVLCKHKLSAWCM